MASLFRSLPHALRNLRRRPTLTLAVVSTFALGIGATSALFSVVQGVLLRPLPFPESDRLVVIWRDLLQRDALNYAATPADLGDYAQARALEAVAGLTTSEHSLFAEDGERTSGAERITVGWTTWNLPQVMKVSPILGRSFAARDGLPADPGEASSPEVEATTGRGSAPPAELPFSVLLGHGLWQRRYGGDPAVMGRSIQIDGAPARVVGVMPAGFQVWLAPGNGVAADVDLWAALRVDVHHEPRRGWYLRTVGRLAPGATLAEARGEMAAIAARQREEVALYEQADLHVRVEPMQADLVRNVQPMLVALFAAVICVLSIACGNGASLLLAGMAGRDRELAVRAALGARPWHLAGLGLGESALLALAGSGVGIGLAWLGLHGVLALAPPGLPRLEAVRLAAGTLAFALAITLGAAALAGLFPALYAARLSRSGHPTEALRGGSAGGALRRLGWMRQGLVIVEVGLSLVLLIGAGLLLRSFIALTRVDPGFIPRGVVTFHVALPLGLYPTAEERETFKALLADRLEALPGVEAVGAVSTLPLAGRGSRGPYRTAEAAARGEESDFRQAAYRGVVPGYFQALQTRLLAGRLFDRADGDQNRPVVLVDEVLARRTWPGEDPFGRRLQVRVPPVEVEVVGVVEHQRTEDLSGEEPGTIYFLDSFLGSSPDLAWTVRTAGDPVVLLPAIRRSVEEMDGQVTVSGVRRMTEVLAEARAPIRFSLFLVGALAGVALGLALAGLYGLLAYQVTRRQAEIGLRMALGARRRQILTRVVGQGLGLAGLGVLLGLAGAVAGTRLLASQLVGLISSDPWTFAGTSVLFLSVAAMACAVPAWRACRIDPGIALGREG